MMDSVRQLSIVCPVQDKGTNSFIADPVIAENGLRAAVLVTRILYG